MSAAFWSIHHLRFTCCGFADLKPPISMKSIFFLDLHQLANLLVCGHRELITAMKDIDQVLLRIKVFSVSRPLSVLRIFE